MIFSCYVRLEQLPDEVKERHKIKLGAKIPRFDVTGLAGYFKPLEALKNDKGQIYLSLIDSRGIINSPDSRRAERYLQGKDSTNVSSLFIANMGAENIVAFGNPPQAPELTPKKDKSGKLIQRPNPFFNNKNDGYLFLIKSDWSVIEMLIIPNGFHNIQTSAKRLAEGVYDATLQTMRTTSTPIFNY
jgi:hypothetical protein